MEVEPYPNLRKYTGLQNICDVTHSFIFFIDVWLLTFDENKRRKKKKHQG